jgi:DNA-binding NarL/FixJ family response regulator
MPGIYPGHWPILRKETYMPRYHQPKESTLDQFRSDGLRKRLEPFGLTPRQEEIAALVIHGLTNQQIAAQLSICEQTVKDHLRNVFAKLDVHHRSELTTKVLGLR